MQADSAVANAAVSVTSRRNCTSWNVDAVMALFELPFADLLYQAQQVHRRFFDPNAVQLSTLLSIKTGGCPEDCSYCPQSSRYDTGVEAEKLMPLDEVLQAAQAAKDNGATRFCMGRPGAARSRTRSTRWPTWSRRSRAWGWRPA